MTKKTRNRTKTARRRRLSHSKANHGNPTHKELILLCETNASRGSKDTIFNLRLRRWCLLNLVKTKNETKSNKCR